MNEVLFLDALRTAPRLAEDAAAEGAAAEGAAAERAAGAVDRLGALVRAIVEERCIDGVDELILGRSLHAGPAGRQDPARAVALAAGLPLAVGGTTVDRGGCAGLQALACGAMAIASGYRDLVIVAATSDAGRPPARPAEGVAWRCSELDEAEALDMLRERFALTRDDEVTWAVASRRRAQAAADLHARAIDGASLRLQPSEHTAARAVDGGVAIVLASQRAADVLERTPRARLVALAHAGLDPGWRGLAAGEAARAGLERASLTPADLDLCELDERHATWTLAAAHHANLPPDRCQVHGGALALGHLGPAEGLRQLLTLIAGLEDREERLGLCATGGTDGQALAVLVDREIYR